jgi:cytochrome c-type biogenesis protein CcmF
MNVSRNGEHVRFIDSSKRFEGGGGEPVTEAGIWGRSLVETGSRMDPYLIPVEDLFVILGGWTENGEANFKVFVNPLVGWIWIGGVVMVVGSVIAFWPERAESRVPVRRTRPIAEAEASRA